MYRIVYDEEAQFLHQPLLTSGRRHSAAFARVPLTLEEQEMSRMTFDGLLLQSNLSEGEVMSLKEIAEAMFCRQGEEVGKIAMSRARQAALNLVTLGNAKAIPNRKEMTHVRSIASCGTQLAAVMCLSIRRSEQNRRETDRLNEIDDQQVLHAVQTDAIKPYVEES